MIEAFTKAWFVNLHKVREQFTAQHPEDYKEIVQAVIEAVTSEDDYDDNNPDPQRVHQIDDGDYQGTLLFVIAAKGYQPDKYWSVKIGYGSCSGCDTLQAIGGYSSEPPNDTQVGEYMQLATHVVQKLRCLDDEAV